MSARHSTPVFEPRLLFNSSRSAQHRTRPRVWRGYATAVVRLRELAPYLVMLVLPGGSVMALLWWLHRRQRLRDGQSYANSML
jgi:hypothetical protein